MDAPALSPAVEEKHSPAVEAKHPPVVKAPPTFVCWDGERSRHTKCLMNWEIPAYETSTEEVRLSCQKMYRDNYANMQAIEKNDPHGRKWFNIGWYEDLYFHTCHVYTGGYILLDPALSDDDVERLLDSYALGEGDASSSYKWVWATTSM